MQRLGADKNYNVLTLKFKVSLVIEVAMPVTVQDLPNDTLDVIFSFLTTPNYLNFKYTATHLKQVGEQPHTINQHIAKTLSVDPGVLLALALKNKQLAINVITFQPSSIFSYSKDVLRTVQCILLRNYPQLINDPSLEHKDLDFQTIINAEDQELPLYLRKIDYPDRQLLSFTHNKTAGLVWLRFCYEVGVLQCVVKLPRDLIGLAEEYPEKLDLLITAITHDIKNYQHVIRNCGELTRLLRGIFINPKQQNKLLEPILSNAGEFRRILQNRFHIKQLISVVPRFENELDKQYKALNPSHISACHFFARGSRSNKIICPPSSLIKRSVP